MDNICKICGENFSERSHFWKKHKTKEIDYYKKYLPKYDLFNKESIAFKNPEQYELADFNTKTNLRKYIESIDKEGALNYLKQYLKRRIEVKNLQYSLSEFELKSLIYPTISYFHKYFGHDSYNKMCLELGLLLKHDFNYCLKFKPNNNLEYIVDSREQSVLPIKNFQIGTLDYGDYTTTTNNGIYIERKSLSDAISTLSQGYERFEREIQRCKNDNNYLIILIEEKYGNLQSFEYMPHIHSKCTWEFISHRIRELLREYPTTIQFLCSDGRKEAVRLIDRIFNFETDIRKIDLEYYYNKEML
jgi:hypothetical protein